MYIVDDPTLALITRFLRDSVDLDVSQDELMERQIAAIRAYVEGFPAEERTTRAREWIEAHAKGYRQEWQRRVLTEQLRYSRCPDCPLTRGESGRTCVIHERWLGLLEDYIAERISSAQYVEDTLELLRAHKTHLKVALKRARRAGRH